MSDPIMSFASHARGAEYGFLPAVLYALEQFDANNNTPMYRLIALVNGKTYKNSQRDKSLTGMVNVGEGDEGEQQATPARLKQFAAPLRRIMARAISGVTFTFRDGKAGVKRAKNGGVNHDVLHEIRELLRVWKNVSVDSDVFKSAFPAVKKETKATEIDKVKVKARLDNYLDKMADELGMSKQALLAFAAAKPEEIARTVEPAH